ncbi:hypothetical protein ABMA28_017234 [Loxostege sticticalis]|uniref:Reverse transcriptase domain-containing protein n=1 Tax=Loxostege sticticalis TaxID=481309 RepID=A0ABD0S218_LOXSC
MELRSKRNRIMPLPGGDRRGAPGADAGRHSMRAIGGEGLGGRPFAGGPAFGGEPEQCEFTQTSQNSCNLPVTPTEDVSQKAPATNSATTKAGKPRVRMKWDDDMNTFIMRTYYYITKLETDRTMYCKNLHDHFRLKYPNIEVSAQRIADQRRVIIRNKLLSDTVLQNIKLEVEEKLKLEDRELQLTERNIDTILTQTHDSSFEDNLPLNSLINSRSDTLATPPLLCTPLQSPVESNVDYLTQTLTPTNPSTNSTNEEPTTADPQLDILVQKLTDALQTALTEYSGIDPTIRPKLPKLRENKNLYRLLDLLNNKILSNFYSTDSDITQVHTLIYCTALVICRELGHKIEPFNPHKRHSSRKQFKKPAWQIRIEKDISKLRVDIGRVTQYIANNNISDSLRAKIELIFKKNQIHSTHERNNKRPEEFLDTLKQKLAIKSQRLRRYKKALQRKEDNKLFSYNEKVFYRNLGQNDRDTENTEQIQGKHPSSENLENYWAGIWGKNAEYNNQAEWIREEENKWKSIDEMEFNDIDRDDIETVTRKMKSWKAAGSDKIHCFWYKKLYRLHDILGHTITAIIKGEADMPKFLTKGTTYMLPKRSNTEDPSQYRPITCLPTLYKLITSCITNKLNTHIENNNILAEEQKGCRRNHMGCKEQLVIDSIILKHAHQRRININITYIDYKKAFDSVPHSWLIRVLQIYKVNPTIITFLENAMAEWKTTLFLSLQNCNTISTNEIPIRNGIFQGDSLSPLWFCLALNPLSNLLNNSNNGFKLTNTTSIKQFSKDINMTFGLDKCRTHRSIRNDPTYNRCLS